MQHIYKKSSVIITRVKGFTIEDSLIEKFINARELECAVFEPVHGSAPDIKGQNKANPTALLLSAIEMLKYIGENVYADKIEKALFKTLADGNKTADLGGSLSTTEFTAKIIANLPIVKFTR